MIKKSVKKTYILSVCIFISLFALYIWSIITILDKKTVVSDIFGNFGIYVRVYRFKTEKKREITINNEEEIAQKYLYGERQIHEEN